MSLPARPVSWSFWCCGAPWQLSFPQPDPAGASKLALAPSMVESGRILACSEVLSQPASGGQRRNALLERRADIILLLEVVEQYAPEGFAGSCWLAGPVCDDDDTRRWEPCGMARGRNRALLATALIGLSFWLSGCRDEEQARPMVKEKGVYQGPADEPIAEGLAEELRSRAASQKF